MTEPLASPDDVRVEINTKLDDEKIQSILERAARDNARENSIKRMEDADRKDLEAALAAHHIVTSPERTVSQKSLGSASKTYEASTVETLEERIRRLDPSNGAVIEHRNQWTVTTRDV